MKKTLMVAAVATLILTVAIQPVLAETIFLKCGADPHDIHTINVTENTVDNVAATINETAIDWDQPMRGAATGSLHFHIDRTTGTLSRIAKVCRNGSCSDVAWPMRPCAKTSAPATKF